MKEKESEKVDLKLNIQNTKIMASGPITSWQIDGETMETVTDFILGGSEITADGDCSHEIKRRLLLGRKAMANLDSILKSKDITLPTKVHLFKAMVFPVVMYGYESWTIRKAMRRRIDAFYLWCWRRLLRVPWTARSNQSILKEIRRTDAEAEAPILWPSYGKNWLIGKDLDWCWERLKTGGEGDARGWDGWMASPIRWNWMDLFLASSGSWWWTGKPRVLQSMGLQRVGHNWVTELNSPISFVFFLNIYNSHPEGVKWHLIVGLIYISLISDIEHLFIYLLTICMSFIYSKDTPSHHFFFF